MSHMTKTIVSNGKAIVVAAWHYELAEAYNVQATAKDAAIAVVKAKYGDKGCTHAQYMLDLEALKSIAEEKSRSYEWLRKCHASAVVTLYKQLPESASPEAIRKREERAAKKAAQTNVLVAAGLRKAPKGSTPVTPVTQAAPVQSNAGAPKGQTQNHPVSYEESIEQFVARHDVFEVLEAVARILAVVDETESDAKALAAVAAKLRREVKRSDVTPEAPVTPVTPVVDENAPRKRNRRKAA
jgi:hypothetical protein